MGISIGHNTNNTYENGDECIPIWKRREMPRGVRLFIYTYAGIIIGGQTYEQSHAYNLFKGCYEYGTEHKTRSARNTDGTTGREENIHTRHRLIETGKQTRKVREGD